MYQHGVIKLELQYFFKQIDIDPDFKVKPYNFQSYRNLLAIYSIVSIITIGKTTFNYT